MSTNLIDAQQLEQLAVPWPDRARTMRVIDQASYDLTSEMISDIGALRKQIADHHAPFKKAADQAHKVVCAAEKKLLDPLDQALSILRPARGAWVEEQRRIREALERKAREAAERQAEQTRLEMAIQAEEMGAAADIVEQVLDTPIPVAAISVQPTFQKAKGDSTRETWSAEVTDLKALCRAIAEGMVSTLCIQPNFAVLNGMARSLKSTFLVPGVRAIRKIQ